DLVRQLVVDGAVTGLHDVADGGLAVCLAELAVRNQMGLTVLGIDGHGSLFSEAPSRVVVRSEEHTSEQSPCNLVCRLLLEKKKYISDLSIASSNLPSSDAVFPPSRNRSPLRRSSILPYNTSNSARKSTLLHSRYLPSS